MERTGGPHWERTGLNIRYQMSREPTIYSGVGSGDRLGLREPLEVRGGEGEHGLANPKAKGGRTMDWGKYDRQVELLCPTCGAKEFEHQAGPAGGEDAEIVCVACDRRTTRGELEELNGERVEFAVDEMAKEVLDDAAKELRETFRHATRGSRNVRLR